MGLAFAGFPALPVADASGGAVKQSVCKGVGLWLSI